MQTSTFQKIGIASLIMMASVFLSRVIGLVREMVIAWAAGAGGDVDAYQVAFILPEILNHMVASGFLSVTFIPIFSGYLAGDEESKGWEIFSIILTVFGAMLLVFIAAAFVWSPFLIRWAAPGLTDPGMIHEAVRMTRIILPAQFLFFSGGMLMAVQFARGRFFIPALAPLIYNLGIIAGGIWLYPKFGMTGFSWGVLIGAFAGNFLLQWFGARRIGLRFSLNLDFHHPDLRKYIYLTLPLMLGLTMSFSAEIFIRFFGSFLPSGGVAALNYGMRIMMILVAFFGQAIGVASFPFMARLASENRLNELNDLLNGTLRSIALMIPFSVLVMVLRREIVTVLFMRGSFDAAAVELTSDVLLFLMIGAFAFAAQSVVARGFYAVQNTLLPAVFSTLSVVISIPFYIYGLNGWGIKGVAMALAVSAIMQVSILFQVWNHRAQGRGKRTVLVFYGKMILFSGILGVVLEGFRRAFFPDAVSCRLTDGMVVSVAVGAIFIIIVGIYLLLFEKNEINTIKYKLLQKGRTQKKNFLD